MTQYDGLEFLLGSVAILPGEHVHLALIHPQLANVGLQEKDVRALHQRVEDLGGGQPPLETAHDLTAFFDPGDVEPPRHVEHQRPIDMSLLRDLLARPSELDVRQIHPGGLPHLDEVPADYHDLFEVSSHLIVHEREPVGYPEAERRVSAREGASVDVHALEKSLRDVHPSGRFEAVVQSYAGREICLVLGIVVGVLFGAPPFRQYEAP
mmetsp:Transcript_22161/g.53683  ORF Transcript_22161/g.53683 Transcript_22161/m.53683 type:complete len:209 (-) Transcript_22161:294-920(-)